MEAYKEKWLNSNVNQIAVKLLFLADIHIIILIKNLIQSCFSFFYHGRMWIEVYSNRSMTFG